MLDGRDKPATSARIYDFVLGGTHNFPADREAAGLLTAMFPRVPGMFRHNRAFQSRAVRFAFDQGVQQFLDLGAGLPTQGAVHEIAPSARVVYVDIDPSAVVEGQEVIDGIPGTAMIGGDMRDPDGVLLNPALRALINLRQPVGVVLCASLHFLLDDDVAEKAVRRLAELLVPGSFLIMSHLTTDDQIGDFDLYRKAVGVYRHRTPLPLKERTREQFARFFDGLELVPPGLTWTPLWRPMPGDPTDFEDDPTTCANLCAVGRVVHR